jgi:mRNA interferase RelE/StbE
MKQIIYTRVARRTLQRMPANTAPLIRSKIEQYAADPDPLANNVLKLQGREGFRLRVGDWRVVFDEDGRILQILKVAPRGGAYDRSVAA